MPKLGEICKIESGGTPSRSKMTYWDGGSIPWIKISNMNGKFLESCDEFITQEGLANSSAKLFPRGTVLISIFATIGEVSILKFPATTNQAIAGLQIIDNVVSTEYLYYFLKSIKTKIENIGRGVAQNNINLSILRNIDILIPSNDVQNKIVYNLNLVEDLIGKAKEQLTDLDSMVKSRFIEMFGNPLSNSQSLNSMPMTDVCDIIDGDRGRNYPTANDFYEDEYCLFLNAKNVTSNGFSFGSCMFITKEKDQCLRKGKLKRGDVVLTTRGTIGNLAYYTDEVPYENVRINSGMVILRMHKYTVNEVFFIEQFKMLLDDIKAKIANGSAQPQLPISTMNKIVMIIPDISKQNQFADFVAQVDKSKLVVQQSLNELETLKKSLMQQYFG